MKKNIFLVILASFSMSLNAESPNSVEFAEKTKLIHHRYYIIKRLEVPVKQIFNLAPFYAITINQHATFIHPRVSACIREIQQTHDAQALIKLWQQFNSYVGLDDELLCIELTKLIMMVLRQITLQVTDLNPGKEAERAAPENLVEGRLISTEEVAPRFFLMKRLTTYMDLIERHAGIIIERIHTLDPAILTQPEQSLTHDVLLKMRNERSLRPTLALWHSFQQLSHVGDLTFTKDFLELLIILGSLIDYSDTTAELTPTMLSLQQALYKIPLARFIDLIEELESQRIKTRTKEELKLPIQHFANLVYRRFYFIHRLKNIIEFAEQPELQYAIPKDEALLMNEMWHDFIHYKKLEDLEFTHLVTYKIFLLSSYILHAMDIKSVRADQKPEELIAIMDQAITQWQRTNQATKSSMLYDFADFKEFADINTIMLRYYHLKRLQPAIRLLKELPQSVIDLLLNTNITGADVHPHIRTCMHRMATTRSLIPLFGLWHHVHQYKDISDINLIKDLAQLILTLYKNLVAHFAHDQAHIIEEELSDIITMYQKIDDLNLEEMLDAISILSTEIPSLIHNYELNAKISWLQWLKKYWWAPPIIIASIVGKLLLNHQAHQHQKPVQPS